ncbi:MAG: hypothetical protein HYX68_16750 [Planctomycetes bacterium]|nr:hypothetical protein [Planctomycetota bacterium]
MADGTWLVSDLIEQLQADPWRDQQPFSDDVQQCQQLLFDPRRTRQEKLDALNGWLAESQPCLFGQMEAKQKRLAFCLLTENDLARSDEGIRQRIEEDRQDWKRQAVAGETHAFIIVAISERIARARPGEALLNLAQRFCELYLGVSEKDTIIHDELLLEIADGGQTERRSWKVGVNYFSTQGDGRWWRDHRIPGGMAYSMNSVGHMARTHVERAMRRDPNLAKRLADMPRDKLVFWALPKAMKTIGILTEGSTRGTWLAERGSFPEDKEPPTFDVRQRVFGDLAQFSENRYKGHYHTDETIPSPYFDPNLWKQEDLVERDDLYFNYLHLQTEEDYMSMGIGIEIDETEGGRVEVREQTGASHESN